MFKRSISLLCSFLIITLIFPFSAFAEGHTHTFGDNKRGLDMGSLPDGYSVPVTFYETPCTSGCGYSQYSWTFCGASGYYVDKSGLAALTVYSHYRSWFDGIYGKNSTATKFEAGGGQPGTGGAGRYPSGYSSEGVSSVDKSGYRIISASHSYTGLYSKSSNTLFVTCSHGSKTVPTQDGYGYQKSTCLVSGNSIVSTFYFGTPRTWEPSYLPRAYYSFVAPVDGYYRCLPFTVTRSYFSSSTTYSDSYDSSGTSFKYLSAGTKYSYSTYSFAYQYYDWVSLTSPAVLRVAYYPADGVTGTTINNQTNITINNNTWNGNIYQDTENNLTYIYPQYTTINDAGDTITNISENPIIYNSTTNQYYTYDSTTNNYYYITYVTATPEPSASPEPSATPDPGTTPTPTPTPGGDTGDTSGLLDLLRSIKDSIVQGFADLTANIKLAIENLNINIKNYFDTKLPDRSTPETAATPTPAPTASASPTPEPTASPEPTETPNITPTPVPDPGTPTPTPNSGSNSNISGGSDEGLFGWLWDLLKDLIKSILKKLFGLLSSLLGFLIWCVERVTLLIPFLPTPAVAALGAGVVLIFVIKLIRFIRG